MKKALALCLVLASLGLQAQPLQVNPKLDVTKQLDWACTKLQMSLRQLKDTTVMPRRIEQGSDQWRSVKVTDWTSGFWAGQLWMAHRHTGQRTWEAQARRWQAALEPNKKVRWTHDLGFMMHNSWGRGYAQTGDPHMHKVLLETAESLASLFNPRTGTMRSWTWRKDMIHPTIIDNMLNLELLWWAADHGGQPQWAEMARTHALTTLKNHIRPNYSTYHVVVYDTATGAVLQRKTDQGLNDESTWARGQAWAIYGFSMAFAHTGEPSFLAAAQGLADYWLKATRRSLVPYWDLDVVWKKGEEPEPPRDASAAAVASSALVQLAQQVPPAQGQHYLDHATATLQLLGGPTFSTVGSSSPALLRHSTGSMPHHSEVDVSLNYADYYYMEALLRLKQLRQHQHDSQLKIANPGAQRKP